VVKKGGILASTAGQPGAEKAASHGIIARYIQNRPNAAALIELAGLMESGKLRPIVQTRLPLSDARKAHEMSQTGHTRGKIVLLTA